MTGPTHQRDKDMKKPVLRTLSAQLHLLRGAEPVPVLLHVIDMGLGLDRHSITMTRKDGGAMHLTGSLSGVTFHPQERRGAPRRIARDMALYIAWHALCHSGMSSAKARAAVLQMWESNGWKGVPDESALGKRLQAAADEWQSGRADFLVGEYSSASEELYLGAYRQDWRPGDDLVGLGWFWVYGTETAVRGRFSSR